MMLNDYKCPKHGVFEASHPICPHLGCKSDGVEKQFLKAPGTRSASTKRFDDGMRKSAEMYRQSDWKSAQEGDMAKANNQADKLLWGDQASQMLGRSTIDFAAKSKEAPTPALGLVSGQSPLQKSERTGMKREDDAWRAKLTQEVRPPAA